MALSHAQHRDLDRTGTGRIQTRFCFPLLFDFPALEEPLRPNPEGGSQPMREDTNKAMSETYSQEGKR